MLDDRKPSSFATHNINTKSAPNMHMNKNSFFLLTTNIARANNRRVRNRRFGVFSCSYSPMPSTYRITQCIVVQRRTTIHKSRSLSSSCVCAALVLYIYFSYFVRSAAAECFAMLLSYRQGAGRLRFRQQRPRALTRKRQPKSVFFCYFRNLIIVITYIYRRQAEA